MRILIVMMDYKRRRGLELRGGCSEFIGEGMSVYSTIGNVARRRTHCPRCDVTLKAVKSGELMLAGCANCRGVWIDRKALEKISKGEKERRFGAAREARGSRGVKQNLKCPICYHWMEAKNFENCPELEVDVCRRHGTWLDEGELRAILMFVRERKGGPSAAGVLAVGEGEKGLALITAKPAFRSTALPGGVAVVAAAASSVAAPGALNAPKNSEQHRSALEGAGEVVMELLEFIPDLSGLGDLTELGEVVGCVAEVGFSLLGGLG